ncbi:MAG TPA: hypothetical protein VKT51_07185 [Candidatus Eremiobacteraceae bacterium]|nr:hypothetical protein [Candidatus Eremiobacteraceae bacterium]
MNGARSALFRVTATALAIVVVVFALAAALGALRLAVQPAAFDGKIVGEIAARVPVTLEPVLISFLLAAALGFVLSLPTARAFRGAVTVIATLLQSLPVFASAIGAVFVSVLTIESCAVPCPVGRQLGYLVAPVVVLTMYQLPFLVDFFDRRRARGTNDGARPSSTVRGLAVLFADRLPSLISAAMIGEYFYRWKGEGYLLGVPEPFDRRDAFVFTVVLIVNALVVLAIRCIVELIVQRGKMAKDVNG